jgi:hypothetical protein
MQGQCGAPWDAPRIWALPRRRPLQLHFLTSTAGHPYRVRLSGKAVTFRLSLKEKKRATLDLAD